MWRYKKKWKPHARKRHWPWLANGTFQAEASSTLPAGHSFHPCKYGSNMHFNILRPRQNARHIPDDIFKCIFLKENVTLSIEISLKFVHKGPINNIPALVQIMAWRRPGDMPLSEPMLVSLRTHICVTRPQWVKTGVNAFGATFYDHLTLLLTPFCLHKYVQS